jgi:photosystem II stability/assembly factor-like uncharacterized protein
VVWVSGTGGRYAFTRDGGATWEAGVVPGADSLDFRDVEAFPDGSAYLMSAGGGTRSRLFKTTNWGRTWSLQHVNELEAGFFNGMAFWDASNGAVVGDPVDGKLFLLITDDGGDRWDRLQGEGVPDVMEGEYGFAASGTNIAAFGEQGLAVVSGGPVARVFRSPDRGRTWTVVDSPLAAGNASSGIFSIAFGDGDQALIAGGDYQDSERATGTLAYSEDAGFSWTLAPEPHGVGFRSGAAWCESPGRPMSVAVGTSGSSVSTDGGRSWTTFDRTPFNAVAFAGPVGWAAGPDGRVARLIVR